ncbi:MAG TPA: hypothetical protein VGV38_00030, partial [Pyrinomonadaceae bacterium]|nr:hypothetical protein [Pyrinomonadaceae bacterium]
AESEPSPQTPPQSALTEAGEAPADLPLPPPVEPDTHPQTVDIQELTPEAPLPPVASEELTQLISLWKSLYRLNDGEVETLCVMYRMSHAQGTDECYVKMRSLARMSNISYRYCQKVIRSLEQLGWITKLKDYDPLVNNTGVLYRVNLKPSV